MGQLVLTALLASIVFAAVLFVLSRVRTPHYQLSAAAVLELLDAVLTGQASDSDWQVFTEIPLRHNECLERCRQRCRELYQQHQVGRLTGRGFLLDAAGLAELAEVRQRLKAELAVQS